MLWLPTPLKAFTDAIPEIKAMLRVCAFHLYDWICDHEDVTDLAREVREGAVPEGYPDVWPMLGRRCLPPGTAPYTDKVRKAIEMRKANLRDSLADDSLIYFPRDEVRDVLNYWKIVL